MWYNFAIYSDATKTDKGAAMTVVLQKAGVGQTGRCLTEELVLASNSSNRVLFHKKLGQTHEKKIKFPLVTTNQIVRINNFMMYSYF